jgi:hypothetical protein
MQTPASLKSITQLAGGEATATVQVLGIGNLDTFHDGYSVSHAIARYLLTPGADVVVDIPDPHHPGDGQVVSVTAVTTTADHGAAKEQFGSVSVSTDGSGNGTAVVTFPNVFSSFSSTPSVTASALASSPAGGTVAATPISSIQFTAQVSRATPNTTVSVAWDATGP